MAHKILSSGKRKPGRPAGTKKPIDYERLEMLAASGLTHEQIAAGLGIGAQTLYRRQHDDEKFKEAFERGGAKGIAIVTSKLFKAIDRGDVNAMIFYLKCKAGWNETAPAQYQNTIKVPDIECTLEEAKAAYRAAMQMVQC